MTQMCGVNAEALLWLILPIPLFYPLPALAQDRIKQAEVKAADEK